MISHIRTIAEQERDRYERLSTRDSMLPAIDKSLIRTSLLLPISVAIQELKSRSSQEDIDTLRKEKAVSVSTVNQKITAGDYSPELPQLRSHYQLDLERLSHWKVSFFLKDRGSSNTPHEEPLRFTAECLSSFSLNKLMPVLSQSRIFDYEVVEKILKRARFVPNNLEVWVQAMQYRLSVYEPWMTRDEWSPFKEKIVMRSSSLRSALEVLETFRDYVERVAA